MSGPMTTLSDLSRAQRHVLALKKHALAGSIGVVVYCEQLLTMYPGEVAYVMRDLGLKLLPSDDERSIIDRIVRAVQPAVPQENQAMKKSQAKAANAKAAAAEVESDEDEEEEEAPKQTKKSKKAKRAAASDDEGGEEGESAPRGGAAVGETLVTLLPKGSDGRKLAQKLADGEELSAKSLGALQTAINEAATEAREEDNGKKASQLSSANRIVRRMRRAAEK